MYLCFFFFNDTATTEIYTLSLHDALPIFRRDTRSVVSIMPTKSSAIFWYWVRSLTDRKSTRLNSSHVKISYAVFCLKKKKKTQSTNKQRSTSIKSSAASVNNISHHTRTKL